MHRLILLGLTLVVAPLSAQTAPGHSHAASSITAADVARRIGIIAADSMMGRDTPSRGLDMTAQYVADQFQSFGLKPGGDDGWFQRYPITRRRLVLDQSRVVLTAGAQKQAASFSSDARYDGGPVPEHPLTGRAMLVGGRQTAESADRIGVQDRIVLYAPQGGMESALTQQVLRVLYLAGPKALLILSAADSTRFAAGIPRRSPERTVIGTTPNRPVALQLREGAVAAALAAGGADLAAARTAGEARARERGNLAG